MSTAWIVIGPADHGVVILAEQLLRALGLGYQDERLIAVRAGDVNELVDEIMPPGVESAHVHFTDQLFGADCATAAVMYRRLADRLRTNDVRLGVTLHDLPLDPDDVARYRRRADAYAAVVAATTGPVIVSSGHEADLLARFAPDVSSVVVPLPIGANPQDREALGYIGPPSDVAILGYLYPGKGHPAALEALTALPSDVGLTVLGRTADGHGDLADALNERAQVLGRRFAVTGWIPDAQLPTHLRGAVVPVVGHERLSASGSIGSWLAAGRRPLVPDGPYTRELAARCPGAVTTYTHTPQGLSDAIGRAYVDPESTWLAANVVMGPSSFDVARAYRDVMSAANAR